VTLNRYVLDANVLISAVLSPNSTAHQAYQKALDTGILLASTQTLAEYENVMLRSKFDRYVSLARRQSFLAELRGGVEKIRIIEFITDCRDAKDNIYLDVAVNGLANVLITGDQDLLILHPYRGMLPILTPSDFVKDVG
jgi:putative PIN family toxin of toxin-antitoxin system